MRISPDSFCTRTGDEDAVYEDEDDRLLAPAGKEQRLGQLNPSLSKSQPAPKKLQRPDDGTRGRIGRDRHRRAVSVVLIVFFLILVGSMVDRYGRKQFLSASAALMALSSVSYVHVHEIGAFLYALCIVQSVAFAYVFAGGAASCVDVRRLPVSGKRSDSLAFPTC